MRETTQKKPDIKIFASHHILYWVMIWGHISEKRSTFCERTV